MSHIAAEEMSVSNHVDTVIVGDGRGRGGVDATTVVVVTADDDATLGRYNESGGAGGGMAIVEKQD